MRQSSRTFPKNATPVASPCGRDAARVALPPDSSAQFQHQELPTDEAVGVHVINPNAVYTLPTAQRALGLKKATLRREIRLRRLRVSKRAGRYYLLGDWLLDWLRSGDIHAPRPDAREQTAAS